jgi:hypothetical protein
MGNPLSNPVPRSDQNAYEPNEPNRRLGFGDDGVFYEDPPVMRPADGTNIKAVIAKHGTANRPAPKVGR